MNAQDELASPGLEHSVRHLATAAAVAAVSSQQHLSLLDKLALWASWGAAAAIFLTLGWMAMSPDDPLGAVSLLGRGTGLSMWLQAAGLAVVASAVATVLVGRVVPYAGPFAAALGLAIVSFRGSTMESLLIATHIEGGSTQWLSLRLFMESMGWLVVIALAFVTGVGVARWCFPKVAQADLLRERESARLPNALFVPVSLAAGLLAYSIIGAGLNDREIRHPQVCFVVGASVWIGCYIAYRIVPARGIAWHVAPAILMAMGGYLWASMQSAPSSRPATVPPSNFLRILPIQFVSVGLAAAIAAYWSNMRHEVDGSDELPAEPVSRRTTS